MIHRLKRCVYSLYGERANYIEKWYISVIKTQITNQYNDDVVLGISSYYRWRLEYE